jgi:hypothetical protein
MSKSIKFNKVVSITHLDCKWADIHQSVAKRVRDNGNWGHCDMDGHLLNSHKIVWVIHDGIGPLYTIGKVETNEE